MIHPLEAECRQLAAKLNHSTITSLHVLAAWLHMPEVEDFPGRSIAQLNVAKRLSWSGFQQEPTPEGQGVYFSDSGRSWLALAIDNLSSPEAISALVSELGVSTGEVGGGEPNQDSPSTPSPGKQGQVPDEREPQLKGSQRVGQATTASPREDTPREPLEVAQAQDLATSLAAVEKLIGLRSVKERVTTLIHQQQVNVALKAENRKTPTPGLNLVFTGNPGTGKTTVARLISVIYRDLGLLSKGHLIEVTQADLVGTHLGETAVKTSAVIDKALGGTLFIDEAYSLADGRSFGEEALATLVSKMEDHGHDFAVIVAGYPEPMLAFLRSNPGLESRFSGTIHFDDYNIAELVSIFLALAEEYSVEISEEVRQAVERHLRTQMHGESSGNGRYVRNLFLRTWERMTLRVAADGHVTASELEGFDVSDVPDSLQLDYVSVTIDEVLAELDTLVGLEQVKSRVRTLTNRVRANKVLADEGKPTADFSLNLVFSGAPGTGKTTVAREVARAYRALGVLPRGHLVEVGRSDLVSSYLGDTARKTLDKIDQAMGGILFIDEAYSLLSGGPSDYGQEAISTLVGEMENRRGKFAVIVAGYKDDMRAFLDANAGLRSRFDDEVVFESLSDEELVQVFATIASERGLTVPSGVTEAVAEHLRGNRDAARNGNARYIRKLFDRAYDSLVNRAAGLGFTGNSLSTMRPEDIPDRLGEPLRQRIGFGE